jgi:hypothetical protein
MGLRVAPICEKERIDMRLNTKTTPTHLTHEGAPAKRISSLAQLRRSVCSTFLWEDQFYEDGKEISNRVLDCAKSVHRDDLAALAIELRTEAKLRHAPLLIAAALARKTSGEENTKNVIEEIIKRPDEMGELLAIHARLNGVGPDKLKGKIPAQMRKGIARAFTKFDAYQLAKYNRKGAITLKDVMRLTHPIPKDEAQSAMWKQLLDGTLDAPDTWEVGLSSGGDKKEVFTRLLKDGKLGYLALLRNLRGMIEAGVDRSLVKEAILARKGAHNVLPFRFVAAARACPSMEPALDQALCETVLEMPPFDGHTIILVDVSYSMVNELSRRSDMTRMDAACALASVFHGDRRVASFSREIVEVPPRNGMAGVDSIRNSQNWSGTRLDKAVAWANTQKHDRLIVITDEQTQGHVPNPVSEKAYMINVASYQNGVGYGAWTHIDGFSENFLRFIQEYEKLEG